MKSQRLSQLVAVAGVSLMVGCDRSTPTTPASAPAPGATAAAPGRTNAVLKTFVTRGVIRELPEGGRTAVIRHEAIPGYMPAMTMELNVRETSELRDLSEGDEIRFQLVADAETHWIEHIEKIGREAPRTNYPTPLVVPKAVRALKPGDTFPNVTLRGEDGGAVEVGAFRGQSVALTFFFTRCPLPDFCPRMSKNFSKARNRLLEQTDGPTNWQFLSISFDADNDSPEVLKSHARNYRGSNPDRWLFTAADTNAMSVLMPSTQLQVAREGASFLHNLRTVVLDTRGRVHRQFDGNAWTAEELAVSLADAARVGGP